jgi:uncharacterized protein
MNQEPLNKGTWSLLMPVTLTRYNYFLCQPMHAILLARIAIRMSMVPSIRSYRTNCLRHFFTYINQRFAGRKKYITVFGGEPLLNSPEHKKYIETLLLKANANELDVAIVTNGYHLKEYIPILKKGRIREVQVTLDGTARVHNSRRMLRGGKSTFEQIVEGIDETLANNIAVNLRMVIDKENIDELPKLANFAIEKGWTSSSLFKTQLG